MKNEISIRVSTVKKTQKIYFVNALGFAVREGKSPSQTVSGLSGRVVVGAFGLGFSIITLYLTCSIQIMALIGSNMKYFTYLKSRST